MQVPENIKRQLFICGLEPGNIDRLQQGKPIYFNAKELGVDCNICIFLGESPEEMARQLGCEVMDIPTGGQA